MQALGPSGHSDTFTRDNLPRADQWPRIELTGFGYPDWLNAGVELTDRMVARGFGERVALIGQGRARSYRDLTGWTSRLARALVEDFGVRPGNRVLIRSANNPAMVACWLAAMKAGAVVVMTMPMLRRGELTRMIDKAEVSHALCDTRMMDELAAQDSVFLRRIVGFDGSAGHDGELDRAALSKPAQFSAVPTGRDDVALLAFTSGTTGAPKATAHFHRDLLIIADGYAREVLKITPDDLCIGTSPLAFTFGLGGLAVFPLRFGAASVLLDDLTPGGLAGAVRRHRATICFSVPTAYRMMLCEAVTDDLSSLRLAVSAGEALPAPVWQDWRDRVGVPLLDGIGATELLHIAISNRPGDSQPATTGRPVSGYRAKLLDERGHKVARGQAGRLALIGPTGCRYLGDVRQCDYVQDGWNLTGDIFRQDEQGRFQFVSRSDDMIVSAGYNIAGPEVEAALLSHAAVAECAVIGVPDAGRGQIVQAHVVPAPGTAPDAATALMLQNHCKAVIAPYKYPRSIVFRDSLPRTATGKIQRFRLRP